MQLKSTGCSIKAVFQKDMNAKSNVTNFVEVLHGGTIILYDSIRRNVDESLLEVSNQLKEVFDRETEALK